MKIMAKAFWMMFCDENINTWNMIKVMPKEVRESYRAGIVPAFIMTIFGVLLPLFTVFVYIYGVIEIMVSVLIAYYGSRNK